MELFFLNGTRFPFPVLGYIYIETYLPIHNILYNTLYEGVRRYFLMYLDYL